MSVLTLALVQGSPAILKAPAMHFLGRCDLQLVIVMHNLTLIFLSVLLRMATEWLDGSSHFTSPFSQGLCHRKLSAAELGILLNFTV